MGLKLNPAILKDQAQSIIDNLKEDNQSLLHVLDTIEQFTGNTDLKSVAWDNMKAQLSNHEAVIQGLLCANEMVIQNSVTLCGSIGDEKLDEDELKDQIEHLEIANNNLSGIKTSLESCIKSTASIGGDVSGLYNAVANYNFIIQLNDRKIEDLEEKIQKLYQIETQTNSLYSDTESLCSSVESGITAIKKSWDTSLGEFNIAGIDLAWKSTINKFWEINEANIQKKYANTVDDNILKMLDFFARIGNSDFAKTLKMSLDNQMSIQFLFQGVEFGVEKLGNKYFLKFGGDILETSMPNKWKNLETFLKKNIADIEWDKKTMKEFIQKGIRRWSLGDLEEEANLTKNTMIELKYSDLSKYLDVFIEAEGNKAKIFKESFKNNFNCFEDFKLKEAKTGFEKSGKILGIVGMGASIYSSFRENMFNREGDFECSLDNIQNTTTDACVDILAGTTASSLGAAIGSAFAPPLGTAIGAVAGVVADYAFNLDIIDINNDGKKDSLVDGAKMALDGACDFVGNLLEGVF